MWEPPESIPNSEVKTHSADDSVGSPHVKVGHCQALNTKSPVEKSRGFSFFVLSVGAAYQRAKWDRLGLML